MSVNTDTAEIATLNIRCPVVAMSTPPETVAGYQLVERLGTGGMGVVYRGVYGDATAAVKLIRHDYCPPGTHARFAAEWRALARMNHPNISKLLSTGCLPEGQPYFIMEYIQGQSLVRHCDTHRLDIPRRLELFAQICDGVHHAHQKGILHRDLKPGNVLVTNIDGQFVPKIIDFGLARPVDETEQRAEHTLAGMILGTPQYMAPEQTLGNPNDVDTRTDVYSLGAILYELLTGTPPIGKVEPHADPASLLSRVRSLDTEPPSQRVAATDNNDTIAIARGTTPLRLMRELRGDLGRVVLKAIQPDRENRYDSVAALAVDIRHVLAHEPVSVVRATPMQRIRKFVKRYPVATASVAVALLAIILGGLASTIGMVRAWDAERLAQQRLTELDAAKAEVERTLRESESAREAAEELNRRHRSLSAMYNDPRTIWRRPSPFEDQKTLAELRSVAKRLLSDSAIDPQRHIWLQTTFASIAAVLSCKEDALEQQREALRCAAAFYGEESPHTVGFRAHLMQMCGDFQEWGELEPLLKRMAASYERMYGPRSPELISVQFAIADLYSQTNRDQLAIEQYRKTLVTGRAVMTLNDPMVFQNVLAYARLLAEEGGPEAVPEVKALMRDAKPYADKVCTKKFDSFADQLEEIGQIAFLIHDYEAAERTFRELIAYRLQHEPGAWDVHYTRSRLSSVLLAKKQVADAEKLALESFHSLVEYRREQGKIPNNIISRALDRVVDIYYRTGRLDQAKQWEQQRWDYIRERAPRPRKSISTP
jgi:eukaryotic-like serine/threonine-protein kinase